MIPRNELHLRTSSTGWVSILLSLVLIVSGLVAPTPATAAPGDSGSIEFDGASLLSYPSNDNLSLAGDYTVEFWTKFATYPSSGNRIVSRWKNGSEEYSLASQGSEWRWSQKTTTGEVGVNFPRPALHTWHHIAAVRSGNDIVVYVDGVSVGTATFSGTVKTGVVSPLDIGGLSTANGGYLDTNNFRGRLSNVRISNTAIYTAAFTPSSSSLVAVASTTLLLNMEEGVNYAKDTSNNSIATIIGTPVSHSDVPFTLTVPAPPAQVRGTSYTGTTSVINWIASSEIAGQGTNTYTVYGSTDGITYAPVAGCIDVSGTSCSASGLLMARGYVFQARAKNTAGYSDYSLLEATTTGYFRMGGSYSPCAYVTVLGALSCGTMANRQPYTTSIMPTPIYCTSIDGSSMRNYGTLSIGVFDADGNMYFPVGNTIRKLAPAGWATAPNCLTTLFSSSVLLKSPNHRSMGIDASGSIYVGNADATDHSVIKISPDGLAAETYLTTAQTVDVLSGIKFDSDQNLIGYQNPQQSIARLVKFANITKTKSYILDFNNAVMSEIGGNKSITGFSLNAFDDIALSINASGQDYVIKFDHTFTQPDAVTCVNVCTTEQNNQNKAHLIYDASRTLYVDYYPTTVKFFAKFEEYMWSQAPAIDSEGNTWIPQQLEQRLLKLDSSGRPVLSTSSGTILDGPSNFYDSVGIDPSGNVLVGIGNGTSAWIKFAGATKPFLRQLTYKGVGSTPYRTGKTAQIQLDGATGNVNFKTTNTGAISVSSTGAVTAASNLEPGKYSVSGTALDSASTAGTWTYTLTVNKALPTVALTSTPNPSIVQSAVTYTATPSEFDSGTVISFYNGASLLGTCIVTSISCSYTTSSIAAGSHSISAVVAESAHYLSATSNSATQVIGTITTGVTWSVSASPTQGQDITFSATVLPQASTGTVTFKDSNDNVLCTTSSLVSGLGTCVWAGNPTRGSYSVTPTYSGDANYSVATGASRTVTITASQSSLSWNLGSTSVSYLGSLNLATTGGSGSGLVTYAVSPNSTCTIAGATLVPGDAGSVCSITATKAAADNYFSATSSPQVISVTKIDQAATLAFTSSNAMAYGQSLTLQSTGGSGAGAVTYSVTNAGATGCTLSGAILSVTAAGTCVVSASRAGSTNYNATAIGALASQSIVVATAPQTLSFTSAVPSAPVVGATYLVSAVSTSGLTPTMAIFSGSCTISGATVSFTAIGNCVVRLTQSGDSLYSAATAVNQTIVVGSRNQALAFSSTTNLISQKTYGDTAFSVSATSNEATAILVYSLGANTTNSACTVTSFGAVAIQAVGVCEIKVNAAGTDDFAVASEITKLIEINPDLPNAPFLMSTSAGNRSITVSFTPPTYEGGSAISGYQLDAIDQAAGSSTVISESGCGTTPTNGFITCTIRGLENGVNYKVRVSAINAAGTSAFSDLSQILTVATNPAAVQQLRVTEGNSALIITWADPDSLGGGTFTEYRIYVKQSSEANFNNGDYFIVTDAALHSISVTQVSPNGAILQNGVAYDVKVVTVTTANLTELTANTAQANKVPRTVPGAPELVDPLIVQTNLVLSWAAPINDGGSAITGYSVVFNGIACSLTNATDTTCVVVKPTAPGRYLYEVIAQNVAGVSAPSSRTFTVAAAVVAPPASSTTSLLPQLDPITGGPKYIKQFAREKVSLAFSNLSDVSDVTIDGKPMPFVLTDGVLVITDSGLEPGSKDIRVTGSWGTITVSERLVVLKAAVILPPPAKKFTVTGFAAGKSSLTAKMKAQVKKFVTTNAAKFTLRCLGYSAGPTVLGVDQALAKARAKSVCAYIKLLSPKVVYSTRGVTTLLISAAARKVVLTLQK